MDRTPPAAKSDEIELYIRTYYSLLRSSGAVRIRSLEETHMGMRSNLHHLADSNDLDISALVYSALRLPEQIIDTHLMVMGQMEDVFEREGYSIDNWKPVRAHARRRKYYYDAKNHTMAAFVASVSDIDDLVPCMSTFQIEWNKIHQKLNNGQLRERLLRHEELDPTHSVDLLAMSSDALDLTPGELGKLEQLWPGSRLLANLQKGGAPSHGSAYGRAWQRAGRLPAQRAALVGVKSRRAVPPPQPMGATDLLCQQQHTQHCQPDHWAVVGIATRDSGLCAPRESRRSALRAGGIVRGRRRTPPEFPLLRLTPLSFQLAGSGAGCHACLRTRAGRRRHPASETRIVWMSRPRSWSCVVSTVIGSIRACRG
jgi:hypothetical protein